MSIKRGIDQNRRSCPWPIKLSNSHIQGLFFVNSLWSCAAIYMGNSRNFRMISSVKNGAKLMYGLCHGSSALLFSNTLPTSSSFKIGRRVYTSLYVLFCSFIPTSSLSGTATKDLCPSAQGPTSCLPAQWRLLYHEEEVQIHPSAKLYALGIASRSELVLIE